MILAQLIISMDGNLVGTVESICGSTNQIGANARLISAAPDLMKSLSELVNEFTAWHSRGYLKSQHPATYRIIERAEAAIKKARGE